MLLIARALIALPYRNERVKTNNEGSFFADT
jgi:hypothetical protein